MDSKKLLSLRGRLGNIRRLLKHGWKSTGWNNDLIVSDDWVKDILKTKELELENEIAMEVDIK